MPDVPFEIEEYRSRAAGVREEMARRDIDVLFVTSAPNTCYLTGFESIWYPPRAPVGVVVTQDSEQIVFCDYERHQNHVQTLAHFDDAIFYAYTTAIDTIAERVRAPRLVRRHGRRGVLVDQPGPAAAARGGRRARSRGVRRSWPATGS